MLPGSLRGARARARAGVGTGGTITGAGRFLRERKPGVQLVAVEPDESAVLSGDRPGYHQARLPRRPPGGGEPDGGVQASCGKGGCLVQGRSAGGLRMHWGGPVVEDGRLPAAAWAGMRAEAARARAQIQGIGAGFVPKVLDARMLDEVQRVSSCSSLAMARRLALEEGLLCGISSGAAVVAAVRRGPCPASAARATSRTAVSWAGRNPIQQRRPASAPAVACCATPRLTPARHPRMPRVCAQDGAAEGEQGQADRGGAALVWRALPVHSPLQRPLDRGACPGSWRGAARALPGMRGVLCEACTCSAWGVQALHAAEGLSTGTACGGAGQR